MKHLMIDLETLGRRPGCVILSIGAVFFDRTGLGEKFYRVCSVGSQVALRMFVEPDTMDWWHKQDEDAKLVLRQAHSDDARSMFDALMDFNGFVHHEMGEQWEKTTPWSNGADFDLPILLEAYRLTELPVPWKFWSHRCFRTLKNLPKDLTLAGPALPKFQGTKHNALDDAVYQAECAVLLLNYFGIDEQNPEAPPSLVDPNRIQRMIDQAVAEPDPRT